MNTELIKWANAMVGGIVGWIVGVFEPVFPLVVVAIVLILYDAWTAYQLDKRVHQRYPSKAKRNKAKFTSFAFGKVVKRTIPNRLALIVLAYMVERWVFAEYLHLPLSYIVTGVVCFEQAWSILENESSCREEHESRLWRMLQRIMIDKTERHFDISLDELREGKVTPEQIEHARRILQEYEASKQRKENKQ